MIESIRVEDLQKIYKQGNRECVAVRDISLCIKRASASAIIGPSGCGKTTFLLMLAGIIRPSKGKIWVQGKAIESLSEKQRAEIRNSIVSCIMQDSFLVDDETVKRNLEIPLLLKKTKMKRIERERQIKEVLKIVELVEKEHEFAGNLSGGEQQRIAIARVILQNTDIILADEPTGALDSTMGEQIFQLLLRMVKEQKKTLILVTHNLELANQCDAVYQMKDGIIQ